MGREVKVVLYVLTDNSVYSVIYLYQNGVYPDKYATKSDSIIDDMPFLGEDDEIIVLSQGLIEWNYVRLYNLVRDLNKLKLKSLRVFSTIELPMEFDYILIQGDLFSGTYIDIKKRRWGKPYKACFASLYKDYDKKKEPMCIDKDIIEEEIVKVNNEVPLHLVKVDIRKKRSDSDGK